ncbi:protealysin inhibitor emfourin [Phytohalomonas tamaricis]|uniref:protealysin inhibitor emfourin n=1 Tax=Phytohalomonas tamaricis TaxID=2081032 RepID=UPI000D0B357F|nr:protealysin inhibitor emfourin [Phytohalomonas tamaricis]
MSRFDELDVDALVKLSREGGVAYMPTLARPRAIDFQRCSSNQRRFVCDILARAEQAASHDSVGKGDQRYFRIEVRKRRDEERPDIELSVPEQCAPQELVSLWLRGMDEAPS